ncbi:MAG: SDR family oxidoreductase [Acidobacteriota bacterium]
MEAKNQAGERKVIFLTGATGHVGQNLVPKILGSDDASSLILLIRGDSDVEVEERLEKLLGSLPPVLDAQKTRERVSAVRGDITLPRLGISESGFHELASTVTYIIHSAASVMFRLPLEEARKINVEGTKNVMGLARQAKSKGRLQRVAYIGTAFVSGNRTGMIKEEELDCGQQFSNSYEQTKFEAEKYVRELCGELPVVIFRPSIIVGDSQTGDTSTFNVIYIPLKYISRGLLKFLPGSPSTSLDIVPVDFVCAAICHILFKANDSVGKTFHLCAGRDKAPTAGEVTDLAVKYFNRFQAQKHISRIKFIPVRWVRILEFFLRPPVREKLEKLKACAPYLENGKHFETANARAALDGTGIEPPPFRLYFWSLLRYSVLANWGEEAAESSLGKFLPFLESQGISR